MEFVECRVRDCKGKVIEEGLCLKHYRSHIQRKERETILVYRPKKTYQIKVCTIDGCTADQSARGLCREHLQLKLQDEAKPKIHYSGNKRFTLNQRDIAFLLKYWDLLPRNEELKDKLVLAADAGNSFDWFLLRENEHRQLKEFLNVPIQHRKMMIDEFLDEYNTAGTAGTNRAIAFCFRRRDKENIGQVLEMTLHEIGMLRNFGVKKRHILFTAFITSMGVFNEMEETD